MNAKDIQKAVRHLLINHDHKFENIYVHSWEADHFSVTSTGYSYEVEIKISKSDFKADFKKPKHHFFKNIRDGHSILPEELSYRVEGWPLCDKFPDLKNFRIEYHNIKPLKIGYTNCPNRFFFACPVGLIEQHEVPSYAGLIYVFDSRNTRVIKKAPLIHKEGFNAKEMLFNKYMYSYIELKNSLERDVTWLREAYEQNKDTRTEKPIHLIPY